MITFQEVRRLLPAFKEFSESPEELDPRVVSRLQGKGISPAGFSARVAKNLLRHLNKRSRVGLCTLRQAATLEKFGIPEPATVLFADVDARITDAKKEQWFVYVNSLRWTKGSLNRTEYEAFLRAASLGVDQGHAIEIVAVRIRSAGEHPKLAKLIPEARNAYKYAGNRDTCPAVYSGSVFIKAPEPEYSERYLRDFVANADPITAEELEAKSEFTCHNRTPAGFLHKLTKLGDSIWVTNNLEFWDGVLWKHTGLVQNLAELNFLQTGSHLGVYFFPNPIDGCLYQLDRLRTESNPEGYSFRCLEAVVSWMYAVLETDSAPPELWLKALCLLELPIVSITDSGGRGAHAIWRVDAKSREHWTQLVQPHREHLIRLGACDGSLAPFHGSRLANCMRGQTGRLQQLLYLSPNSDNTPIAMRPRRESAFRAGTQGNGAVK